MHPPPSDTCSLTYSAHAALLLFDICWIQCCLHLSRAVISEISIVLLLSKCSIAAASSCLYLSGLCCVRGCNILFNSAYVCGNLSISLQVVLKYRSAGQADEECGTACRGAMGVLRNIGYCPRPVNCLICLKGTLAKPHTINSDVSEANASFSPATLEASPYLPSY